MSQDVVIAVDFVEVYVQVLPLTHEVTSLVNPPASSTAITTFVRKFLANTIQAIAPPINRSIYSMESTRNLGALSVFWS